MIHRPFKFHFSEKTKERLEQLETRGITIRKLIELSFTLDCSGCRDIDVGKDGVGFSRCWRIEL